MKRPSSLVRLTRCAVGGCLGWVGAALPAHAAKASATASAALGAVAVAVAVLVSLVAAIAIFALWMMNRRRSVRIEDEARGLRQDVEDLRKAIQSAPAAHAIFNRETHGVAASPELVSLFGWRLEPTSLDTLVAHFADADAAALKDACLGSANPQTQAVLELEESSGGRCFGVTVAPLRPDDGSKVLWFRETTPERTVQSAIAEKYQALDEDRGRLSQVLDSLPMPVWLRAADHSLVWINRAHRVAVEAGTDATIPIHDMELVPGLEAAEARALAKRAAMRNEPQAERRRFVVGGERRSFELVEIPLASGKVVGFAHDITERDDAVGELSRYSEANMEIFNRLQSAIAIFNGERHLTFYNDAFVRLWQFEEAWLERQPRHDEILENLRQRRLLPEQIDFPAYRNAILEHYTSLMEPYEEMEVRPDGTTVRSVMSPHPLGGLMVICEDVTDRLELQRARNTSQAVQRVILDQLLEGLAVFGSDGRLKLFNAGFSRIWHLPEEFLTAEPHVTEIVDACRDLLRRNSQDMADWDRLVDRIIENALERESHTGRLHLSDGRTIRCSGMPLPDGAMLYTYVDAGELAADNADPEDGAVGEIGPRSFAGTS